MMKPQVFFGFLADFVNNFNQTRPSLLTETRSAGDEFEFQRLIVFL